MSTFKSDFVNSSSSSKGIGAEGNTRTSAKKSKQVSPALKWCFTWNNYPEGWYDSSIVPEISKLSGWIIGEEVGEEGTPHLQGFIIFKKKSRPMGLLPKEVHWEKCKGTIEDNIKYCSKDGKYKCSRNCKPPREIKCITELRPWQQDVVDIVEQDPDDRSINWYWERKGGIGKSALCRYLCINYGAICLSGKGADMKHAICEMLKRGERAPEIIILDVPRSNLDFLSYTGIEEVKNGCFFSGKYEGGQVIMPFPHIIVFANEEPAYGKLSKDRWNVVCLDKSDDVDHYASDLDD